MNNHFKLFYTSDHERYGNVSWRGYIKWFHYYFRKSQTCEVPLLKFLYRFCYRIIREKHGMEIPSNAKIGKGLYIGHPYNITINSEAVLGENVNIHKGVTIGQTNRGSLKGAPFIGNRVWIGINAVIVGKIRIGDDVLIAPNCYVNRDIPDHSVVFGNPCIIKYREKATEGYINNAV